MDSSSSSIYTTSRRGRKRLRKRTTNVTRGVRHSYRIRKAVAPEDVSSMSHRSRSSSSSNSSDNEHEQPKPKETKRMRRSMSKSKDKGSMINKFDSLLCTPVGKGKRNIQDEIQPIKPDTMLTFDSVGGLSPHINKLKEMVILPLLYKEFFSSRGISPARGVLFHGPPGTGKTLLARAIAGEATTIGGRQVSVFLRKGADILNKWVGESERHLKLLFEQACLKQPSIIFFDEIDGLAPMRSSKTEQIHNSVVSTLLAEMDGLCDRGDVIVIGATNRIETLDPALRRPGRFDLEFEFMLPSYEGRRDIFSINLSKWTPKISSKGIDELALMTSGYSGADIKMLCAEASLCALRRRYPQIYRSNQKFVLNYDSIEVLRADWMAAAKVVGRSTERSVYSTFFTPQPLPRPMTELLHYAVKELQNEIKTSFPYDPKTVLHPTGKALMVDMGLNNDVLDYVISAALWNKMDGISMKILTIQTLATRSSNSADNGGGISIFFSEAKRSGTPVVIYIPFFDHFIESLSSTNRLVLEQEMSRIFFHPFLVIGFCRTNVHLDEYEPFFKRINISIVPTEAICKFTLTLFAHLTDIKVSPQIDPEEELEIAPFEPPSPQVNLEQIHRTEREETKIFRELRIFLREIIFKLIRNKKFAVFTTPVDAKEVPDYYEVVANPMDLETMMLKVTNGEYRSASEFLEDINLIKQNCLSYNPTTTDEDRELRFRAHELKDVAASYIEKEMDSDFEDLCQEIIKRRQDRNSKKRDRKNSSGYFTESDSVLPGTSQSQYHSRTEVERPSSTTSSPTLRRGRKKKYRRRGRPLSSKNDSVHLKDVSTSKSLEQTKTTGSLTKPDQSSEAKSENVVKPDEDGYISFTGNLKLEKEYRKKGKILFNKFAQIISKLTVKQTLELRFTVLNLIEQHGKEEDKPELFKKLTDLAESLILPSPNKADTNKERQ